MVATQEIWGNAMNPWQFASRSFSLSLTTLGFCSSVFYPEAIKVLLNELLWIAKSM
jgi:hypothetical protein